MYDKPFNGFKKILIPYNISALTDLEPNAVEEFALGLGKLEGFRVVRFDGREYVSPDIKNLFARVQGREIWQAHGKWVKEKMSYLSREVQDRLTICEKLSRDPKDLIKADLKQRGNYIKKLKNLIGDDGLMCLPILAIEGPGINMNSTQILDFRSKTFPLVVPSSFSGLPQLSAPIPGSRTNIGLMGPAYSDVALLDLFKD